MDNLRQLQRFLLFRTIAALTVAGGMLLAVGLAAPARAQEPVSMVVIHIQDVSPKGGVLRLGLYDEARYPDDDATPVASAGFCSARLDKETAHGQRKTKETVTFDQEQHQVKRETQGGGHSEFTTDACARDALALLQFVRKELEQGHLAPQQTVIFGGEYQIRFEYTGVQRIKTGETTTDAERIQTSITGPGNGITLELFFARDAARTPLLARIPLPIGTLTVEIAH